MIIHKFAPPLIEPHCLEIGRLNKTTGKEWIYAPSGRAALYAILTLYEIKSLLMPSYICCSVLKPIKKIGIKIHYYDVNLHDLNSNFDSLVGNALHQKPDAIMVASMYGNPDDLSRIESFCRRNEIIMIDDAAQSFGAMLDKKHVGTFGDAGFFSFSPGKPLAAHQGAFMWANKELPHKRKNAFFRHKIKWFDFYLNRYLAGSKKNSWLGILPNISARICEKFFPDFFSGISDFEKPILGGVLNKYFFNRTGFRKKYFCIFNEMFSSNGKFNIVTPKRGAALNHKIVLIFPEKLIADMFIKFMEYRSIYIGRGYVPLSVTSLPNCKLLSGRICELPIEDSENKMNYLFSCVKEYIEND